MKYNEVQVSRFDSFVRKFMGVKNGGALVTLSPEVSAEFSLNPSRGENQYPLGYVPASCIVFIAAGGAGTYGSLLLTAPIGFVVEVQRVIVQCGVATTVTLGRWSTPNVALAMSAPTGAVAYHFARDSRYRDIAPGVSVQYGVNNSATLGNIFTQVNVPTILTAYDVDVIVHADAVSGVQGALSVVNQTANQALNIGLDYRYRQIEPGETF